MGLSDFVLTTAQLLLLPLVAALGLLLHLYTSLCDCALSLLPLLRRADRTNRAGGQCSSAAASR